MLRREFLCVAVLSLLFCAPPAASDDIPPPRVDSLKVTTDKGTVSFQIELADTASLRERGLMFRHRMPEDSGMLFVYDRARPVTFWMKNTYIPLDLIFIRADGKVAEVVENAEPLSEDLISPRDAVLAVLEVLAGTARRYGIGQGSVVHYSLFGNSD